MNTAIMADIMAELNDGIIVVQWLCEELYQYKPNRDYVK